MSALAAHFQFGRKGPFHLFRLLVPWLHMTPVGQLQPTAGSGPVRPVPSETAALQTAAELLQRPGQVTVLIDGEELVLPPSLSELLRIGAAELGRGNSVFVVAVQAELTTQQAADLLNVSRPYLVKLIEAGDLPAKRVGSHRRVLLHDVLDYKARVDQARAKGLDKLSQISEDLGIPF